MIFVVAKAAIRHLFLGKKYGEGLITTLFFSFLWVPDLFPWFFAWLPSFWLTFWTWLFLSGTASSKGLHPKRCPADLRRWVEARNARWSQSCWMPKVSFGWKEHQGEFQMSKHLRAAFLEKWTTKPHGPGDGSWWQRGSKAGPRMILRSKNGPWLDRKQGSFMYTNARETAIYALAVEHRDLEFFELQLAKVFFVKCRLKKRVWLSKTSFFGAFFGGSKLFWQTLTNICRAAQLYMLVYSRRKSMIKKHQFFPGTNDVRSDRTKRTPSTRSVAVTTVYAYHI